MKVLVIAPQPFFTPRGTPFSIYYRTLVMGEQGVHIDLLTYGQGQDIDLPNVRIFRIPTFQFLGSPRIGPSPLKAFLDCFLIIRTIALLLFNRYDYVHAHEEAVFWCRFLKPIFRFKLVYDMHSSLPQQLGNFQFTTSRLFIRLFERLEDAALRNSDAVITICPDLAHYALSRGVSSDCHFLIENSIFEEVRLRESSQSSTNGSAPEISPSAGPRIIYAGTFEAYQGLDLLIDAFANVHQQRSDAQLVMVGGEPAQVEALRRKAVARGLRDACVFTGRVPKGQACDLLATADIAVSPRIDGTNTPLKIYEQLASGKPLVATNIWSHTQVLNKRVCFLVDPTPESMAQGLLEAINQPEHAQLLARAARKRYETQYSRDAYEQKIRHLLHYMRTSEHTPDPAINVEV